MESIVNLPRSTSRVTVFPAFSVVIVIVFPARAFRRTASLCIACPFAAPRAIVSTSARPEMSPASRSNSPMATFWASSSRIPNPATRSSVNSLIPCSRLEAAGMRLSLSCRSTRIASSEASLESRSCRNLALALMISLSLRILALAASFSILSRTSDTSLYLRSSSARIPGFASRKSISLLRSPSSRPCCLSSVWMSMSPAD